MRETTEAVFRYDCSRDSRTLFLHLIEQFWAIRIGPKEEDVEFKPGSVVVSRTVELSMVGSQ